MWRRLWDILFPERCIYCRHWGKYLCDMCWNRLVFLNDQHCPYCQNKSTGGITHNPLCTTQPNGNPRQYHLDGLLSAIKYNQVARRLIAQFKYYPQVANLESELRKIFVRYFTPEEEFFSHKTIITAVPLHWTRRNERGFNQAEVIAQILAKLWELSTNFSLLARHRNTTPQIKLKKKERAKNIRGAFKIKDPAAKNIIHGSSIVIVDDVWTTGSTLKECAKVLKQSGRAKEVWAVTLARD